MYKGQYCYAVPAQLCNWMNIVSYFRRAFLENDTAELKKKFCGGAGTFILRAILKRMLNETLSGGK